MVKPTIHLNGTGATTLIAGYEDALAAMRVAIEKMADAGPNARDYYVQNLAAFTQARQEHQARLTALRQVQDDMMTLLGACQDQS